ncbi:MAG: carbonic anhydrase [Planctomycetota bacterium]
MRSGNERFVSGAPRQQPLGEGTRRSQSFRQNPFAVILACADSRVPPEHVFDAGLGEVFVIRSAGPVCDPESLASLEYAVQELGAQLCLVMTHEDCGALRASLDGRAESPAQAALQKRISAGLQSLRREGLRGRDLAAAAEEEHVHAVISQALRRSEILRKAQQSERFRILPARYRMDSGQVEWLPERAYETADAAPETEAQHRPQKVRGMPPHLALKMLRAGHRRFLAENGQAADLSSDRRRKLLQGQRPLAVVVTCADSRVSPERIFDMGLGEIYVIRVLGNVLNDEVLASVEYAVEEYGASLVLALGHRHCAAIRSALEAEEGDALSPSMRSLHEHLAPAIQSARASGVSGEELAELAGELNAQLLADQLIERSQLLRRDQEAGLISTLSAVYELGSGDLHWLSEEPRPGARIDEVSAAIQARVSRPVEPAGTEAEGEASHETSLPAKPLVETDHERESVSSNESAEPPVAEAGSEEGGADLLQVLFAATMISSGGVLFLMLRQRRRQEEYPDDEGIEFQS